MGVRKMRSAKFFVMVLGAAALAGCATETSRTLEVAKVESASTLYRGAKTPVAVGRFENRSTFMRGIFTDGIDRLGGQAKSTLIAHLQQSQRFNVLDRDNLKEGEQEAQFQAKAQSIRGAEYLVTG